MKRIIISMILCISLFGTLVGCGTKKTDTQTTDDKSNQEQAEPTKQVDSEDSSTDYSKQDPYVVKIVVADKGDADACAEVAAKANEITVPKFNTSIEIVRYGFGEWEDQVQLMLASGEKIDLMASLWLSVGSAAGNGQILPLDDLLAKYGQDMLKDINEQDWACSSVNGQIYGVRNNKELACGYGVAMRTDVLQSVDYDYKSIKSEEDLTKLLAKVKEKYPDMYPICSDFGTMGNYLSAVDWLGKDFGVLENALASDTNIVNWWTSDTYKKTVEVRHQWVKDGLMMPDPTINSETAANLISAGKAFCYLTDTKPGIEGQWERNTGKDMTVINIVPVFSITSNLSNLWYIPYTCEKPERAMQILNEMYTNPELANILIYGVEGKNYKVTDVENGIIDYADGVDSTNSPYAVDAWMWPNELISYKWATDGATIWDDTVQFNKDAVQSPAKGFAWDSSSVNNEIVACNTVLEKYRNGLDTGELDPKETLPKLEKEFAAAGIQKILDEKQRQLDAWLAAKK